MNVEVGVATVLGVVGTVVSAVGTVVAAVKANDVATAVAGTSTILTAVATLGGRFAQAVALIRHEAKVVGPWVYAAQEATK